MPKTLRPKEREAEIQKTIIEGLSALHIWHMRCNSGAMFAEHGGKKRMLRFGRKGMADILALPYRDNKFHACCFNPTWIEVKRPGEKQTSYQIAFQAEVEQEGHRYLVITSWEELLEKLR